MKTCVRVREGGEVLQRIEFNRFCFACRRRQGGKTLFMLAADWSRTENVGKGPRTGKVVTAEAPAPGAGWRKPRRRTEPLRT
jgi:hypothetical protein